MTFAARSSSIVAVVACAGWAVGSALLTVGATARMEYALAAHEARAVATATREDPLNRPSPRRRIVAEGSLARVRVELGRFAGAGAARAVTEDRVIVHGRGLRRAVSVPVKDRDEWDLIGAVALEAEPWRSAPVIALAIALAFAFAAPMAVRWIGRLEEDRDASVYAAMIVPCAALAVAMALLMVVVRLRLDDAVHALPPPAPLARFDALAIPLPDAQLVGVLLAVVLAAGVATLFAAGWAASARRRPVERREALTAWAFLAPSALHLLVFTAGPLLFTLYVSAHDWDLLAAQKPFIGIANYLELARDPLFWNALRNTVIYSLYVPVSMAAALGVALLLDQPLRGVRVLRAIVFLPTVVSYVAIAIVWQWIFNFDYGLLNAAMRALHLPAVDWLSNPTTALPAVMLVSAWVQIGYQMVIYLAGLQGIPQHLHEAARLDGAGTWQRFTHITWPLLRPVSVFLFVTGIIWSFQVFALVYVMTEGGPVHSTDVLVYQIYQNAWEFRRMGYASAMSWVLFALLIGLAMAQWKLLNRRVDYAA